MDNSIAALKKELSSLGISTVTPGLNGIERQKELERRLNLHLNTSEGSNKPVTKLENAHNQNTQDLSVAELKSRLESLKEVINISF
jgi:hypothetical protein